MKSTLVLAFLCGLALPARAQIQPGAEAPAIEVTDWFNHEKMSFEGLRGRVVGYTFVRLDDRDSLFFLELWEELCNDLALQPVTLLAITNESPAAVKEAIEIEEIGVPVLINPTDEAAKAFDVQIFPSVFIQDARGTLSFSSAPGTRQEMWDSIVEAVRFARPFPEPPKQARGLAAALKKWQLDRAAKEIEKELGKPRISAKDQQVLNDTRALILSLGSRLKKCADYGVQTEKWRLAVTSLSRLIEEHQGLQGSEGAEERLSALKARDDLGDEIAAAILAARAERFEREENWKSAVRTYESLAKQYPETQCGKYAAGQAIYLEPRAK